MALRNAAARTARAKPESAQPSSPNATEEDLHGSLPRKLRARQQYRSLSHVSTPCTMICTQRPNYITGSILMSNNNTAADKGIIFCETRPTRDAQALLATPHRERRSSVKSKLQVHSNPSQRFLSTTDRGRGTAPPLPAKSKRRQGVQGFREEPILIATVFRIATWKLALCYAAQRSGIANIS